MTVSVHWALSEPRLCAWGLEGVGAKPEGGGAVSGGRGSPCPGSAQGVPVGAGGGGSGAGPPGDGVQDERQGDGFPGTHGCMRGGWSERGMGPGSRGFQELRGGAGATGRRGGPCSGPPGGDREAGSQRGPGAEGHQAPAAERQPRPLPGPVLARGPPGCTRRASAPPQRFCPCPRDPPRGLASRGRPDGRVVTLSCVSYFN